MLELLRGRKLSARVDEGMLPLSEASASAARWRMASRTRTASCTGTSYVTPGNVFLCDDGPVKVLDFGMAHAFGCRQVRGGTPASMAPEQRRRASGESTEVFALGVILYRMFTGRLPFGEGGERVEGSRSAHPFKTPDVPGLAALVARFLARVSARHDLKSGSTS